MIDFIAKFQCSVSDQQQYCLLPLDDHESHYFRVKGVDAENHVAYSNTVLLNLISNVPELQVFPTITSNEVYILARGTEPVSYSVFDWFGRRITHVTSNTIHNTLSFADLGISFGNYLLVVEQNTMRQTFHIQVNP